MPPSADREAMLFISPAWPRLGGTGLAMRAWAVSEALARHALVSIFVPRSDGLPLPSFLPENCHAAPFAAQPGIVERIRRELGSRAPGVYARLFRVPSDWPAVGPDGAAWKVDEAAPFQRVHVFRHAMAPFAEPFFGKLPCHLDLDESESQTRSRLASLSLQRGLRGHAAILQADARFYGEAERAWLPRFQRIYVSSALEAERLRNQLPAADIRILPNTVALPPREAIHPKRPPGPFTFLFVGNLNYLPNGDAVRYFGESIFPKLCETATTPFRVRIAGGGGATLPAISHPAWQRLGFVEDLAAEYQQADAVIVPLRAGGGTRIKILEAFSWQRPVVSTTLGAEGLQVADQQHLLLADTPDAFHRACLRLLSEPELRSRLAAEARLLVESAYSREALPPILA